MFIFFFSCDSFMYTPSKPGADSRGLKGGTHFFFTFLPYMGVRILPNLCLCPLWKNPVSATTSLKGLYLIFLVHCKNYRSSHFCQCFGLKLGLRIGFLAPGSKKLNGSHRGLWRGCNQPFYPALRS